MALITSCKDLNQRVVTYVCECVEDCLTATIYRGCCHLEEVSAYLKERSDAIDSAVETLVKEGSVRLEDGTIYPTLKMLRSTMTFRGLDEVELTALISGLQA